jgi:hypothetical protein
LETSRLVHIVPFRRNVFITQHAHQAADLEEYKWLLMSNSNVWYEKPHLAYLKQIKALKGSSCILPDLLPLFDARPVSLETPHLWASRALTTPTDDDVCGCSAGHMMNGGHTSVCDKWSLSKSDSLKATDLEYCLIMTTYQASNPYTHGAHFNGRMLYKMVKYGSREAAMAGAFYEAGAHGWNLAFSCITEPGKGFADRTSAVEKMEELWQLADRSKSDSVRVFY